MIRFITKQFIGLWVVVYQTAAFAQSPMAEAKKINEWYTKKSTFQATFQYILYKDSTSKEAVEQHKGFFVRKGANTYLNALGTENLVNAQYRITINHEQKVLLAYQNNPVPQPQASNAPSQVMEIEQFFEKVRNMKITKQSKNRQILTMFYKDGEYSHVKLVYNPLTYQLLELHMAFATTEGVNWPYPGKLPYLVIKYNKVKANHKVRATLFDEKKYIEVKNGNVKPAPAFKTYQLFSTI